MMSSKESDRRTADEAIHSRKLQIANYDMQLAQMRMAGIIGEERDTIKAERRRLSCEQGIDKGVVRRQERQGVLRRDGVALRRMISR